MLLKWRLYHSARYRVVEPDSVGQRRINVDHQIWRQYGAVRRSLGRLTPLTAQGRSERTCGRSNCSKYSRVERLSLRASNSGMSPLVRANVPRLACSDASRGEHCAGDESGPTCLARDASSTVLPIIAVSDPRARHGWWG